MPNTPAQFPNFDLPGAEWFTLAPNAQIAIQGRRAKSFRTDPYNVPTGQGFITGFFEVETGFIQSSGIYIHRAWLMIQPQDFSDVVIESANISLNVTSAPNWGFPLGASSATLTTPAGPFLIIDQRDQLITQRDLAQFLDPLLGSGPPYPPMPLVPTLNLNVLINTANPGAPQPNVTASVGLIYTRLDGLTQ